jgi:hypothetical protein
MQRKERELEEVYEQAEYCERGPREDQGVADQVRGENRGHDGADRGTED